LSLLPDFLNRQSSHPQRCRDVQNQSFAVFLALQRRSRTTKSLLVKLGAFSMIGCFLTGLAAAQVSVSSPAANSNVSSPFHVGAVAKSSHPITAMRIYLDDTSIYFVNAAQISTSVSASKGTHHLVVQAWDSAGTVLKTPLTITVGSSTTPTPTPTPVPTNTTVYDEVQQYTGWLTCGACGNTGGDGALASYSMIRGIGYPTLSGSSAEFKIGGTHPFADAYWYFRHAAVHKALKALRYEFDLYVPAGEENAPQALEWECQQRINGYTYNFAWQALYAGNRWRVFNFTKKVWEDAGISLQRFSPGTWHHIVAEYHDDLVTHTVFHDALTVDGVRHALKITHPATPGTRSTDFTNAFQLDLNGTPTPFHVFVDNMKITYVD
jgi:hypothetical protein